MPATVNGSNPELRSPLMPPEAPKKLAGEHEPEKLCIDDMLQKYCGEFGRWQLRHFVLTSLAWALEGFHTMVMIFADREPDWRCRDGGWSGAGCDAAAKSLCGMESGSWEWIGGPESSTIAEWGLFCGEKYKIGVVQSLFFGGCMIGKFSLSDFLSFIFLFIILNLFSFA